jgi:hypothetical protein
LASIIPELFGVEILNATLGFNHIQKVAQSLGVGDFLFHGHLCPVR